MGTLFIYMVKTAVYLLAFYLVYSLLLSRDTSYIRNRVFILGSLASSLILPFFTLQTLKPLDIQFFGKLLSEVFITASSGGSETLTSGHKEFSFLQVIYTVYVAGVIVIIIKLLIDLISLLFLIARKRNRESRIIRFYGFNTAGFTAMGYIFINDMLSPEEAGAVIRHEQNHLKHNHFIDIIFIETVKAFQWYNPFVYLFNRSLRAIHEYQADEGCLSSGVPVVNYQSLLLSQVFKSRAFNLTNSFSNPSLIKKRMIMMTKKRTSAIASIKLFLAVPVVGLVFLAISAYKEIPNITEISVTPIIHAQSTLFDFSSKESNSSTVPSNKVSTSSKARQSLPKAEIILPPPPPPPASLNAAESNEKPAIEEKEEINEEVKKEVISEAEAVATPFVVVEEMPTYPGGDKELLEFIRVNTHYPEIAKENHIQGKVIIKFCVTAKGSVSQISALKEVSPELDREGIRVVQSLPAFNPGKQGGKPVPVWYSVPITFTLK